MALVIGRTFYQMIGKALGLPGGCYGITITCDGPDELVEVLIRAPLKVDDGCVPLGETFYLVPTNGDENVDSCHCTDGVCNVL